MIKMMSWLLLFFLFLFNTTAGQDMLLIDKHFKTPPQHVSEFQPNQFFNNKFPVYTSELPLIKKNAEALARMLDRFDLKPLHQDTLNAGLSKIIFFYKQNGNALELTVMLSTRVNNMELNLTLINQEHNKRNAQLKLLGLIDYLSTHMLSARR